jgi:hypothetical protein
MERVSEGIAAGPHMDVKRFMGSAKARLFCIVCLSVPFDVTLT